MRRYDDSVEVRRGRVSSAASSVDAELELIEGPEQFLWRGRLWKVRRVLARWVETGAWWQSSEVHATLGTDTTTGPTAGTTTDTGAADSPRLRSAGDLLGERELWRVEAGRGGLETDGVFELSFDWTDGRWQLIGCAD